MIGPSKLRVTGICPLLRTDAMAPVRRYLKISKHSVLECRIYLDNPSLAQSWLLNPRDTVLQRVIESIRPLVLPKLREERQRDRKKGTRKKAIKDVVVQDDFEVSIFLTETSTRHSLLAKHKHFRDEAPRIKSDSSRILGETQQDPIELDTQTIAPGLRLEADEEEAVCFADLPLAEPRRRETATDDADAEAASEDGAASAFEVGSDDGPALKRPRAGLGRDADSDDKKKLTMDVSYEGFAIYGRVLCLAVTRRDSKAQHANGGAKGAKAGGQGQAKMTNWISSTQAPAGEEETA